MINVMCMANRITHGSRGYDNEVMKLFPIKHGLFGSYKGVLE
jgi:hypothetical protein